MTLYDRVDELHGHRPWGSVLDAGTGPASLRWVQALDTVKITAVTGSSQMQEKTLQAISSPMRPQDRIIVGNWVDRGLLAEEQFDVVLADYLLGAIEGFAPYWQDQLFARLRPLVKKRIYVIGLQPYLHARSDCAAGRLISEIGRLRDASLLLAGDRPYREFPLDWTLRSLETAGFHLVDAKEFPINYGARFVESQLAMCSQAAAKLTDRKLAMGLLRHAAELKVRALTASQMMGGLPYGSDYIIAAEPA